MTPHRITKTALEQGQTMQLRAGRGTTIAALRGTVRICGAPRWLAEQWVAERVDLSEGGCHLVQDAGWMSITASSAAEVACVAAQAPVWRTLLRALIPYWASLRRRRHAVLPSMRRS